MAYVPYYAFPFLALFLLISCQSPSTTKVGTSIAPEHQAWVDSVKTQYAPDKRVATFAIEAIQKKDAIVLRGESNLPTAKEELLRLLDEQNLSYIDSIILLPTADLGERTFGIVRQSVANLRTEPKHSAELTTQAMLGTPLKVLKKQGHWYQVQVPDGYIAWLDRGGFEKITSDQLAEWRQSKRLAITEEYDLVYQGPSLSSAVIGDVVAGNILEWIGEENGYQNVRYPDDREGYILSQSTMPLTDWLASHRLDNESIFATAKKYIGRPYLWGGTSGKGMDCSGFTKTVYFRHGLILPRDASQQVHAGSDLVTDTNLENFQAGDFLFFGNYREDGSKRVTHVGIYLGDGRFIHSGADNGAVAIQSLRPGEPDYAADRLQSLIAARRMMEDGQPGQGIVALQGNEWYFE